MSDVFISYSRNDTSTVDQICDQFDAMGISYWIDRKGIAGGEQWRREIVEAIAKSAFFVIVISRSSTNSINVLKELNVAESKNKKILPVIIDQAEIPHEMEYQLAGLQNIDLTRDFMAGMQQIAHAINASSSKTKQKSMAAPQIVPDKGKGVINLQRKNASNYDTGQGGNYGVWIDDAKVGTIAYGNRLMHIANTGPHTIYVEWLGFKSNILQLHLKTGQEIELVCGEEQGILLGRLFVRTRSME